MSERSSGTNWYHGRWLRVSMVMRVIEAQARITRKLSAISGSQRRMRRELRLRGCVIRDDDEGEGHEGGGGACGGEGRETALLRELESRPSDSDEGNETDDSEVAELSAADRRTNSPFAGCF